MESALEKSALFTVDAVKDGLSVLWCFERLFLKSSSGRQRYNVLGAYSVQDTDLITITNDASINSDTLRNLQNCRLLSGVSEY
jgi:hypothetical protein